MSIHDQRNFNKALIDQDNSIPNHLVYEMMDGIPLYYHGYKDVVTSKRSLDDIMGSSTLQSFIITYLLKFIFKNLNEKKYLSLTNELGLHLSKKNNLAGDINIFDLSVFPLVNINTKYSRLAPKIVCEVDSKVDMNLNLDYIKVKTEKLLSFGVEKVIWIYTKSYKVTIARKNEELEIVEWDCDVELIDGHFFNIGQYLRDQGIILEYEL